MNGCTSFTDVSGLAGGNPSIVWTNGGDFNNGPVCLRITQTHTVTFNTLTGMTFVNHPIKAAGSGTTPTPFPTPPAADAVTTKVFTFPNVGTYGFQCNIHSGSMIGAIKVDGN